jgi:D-alanine-D-alanine ligase
MTIDVNPDWWKTLFDEVYLVTDARSVCNEETTRCEVDIFSRLLPMAPEDRVLDLCGGHGRHTLELCRRGYQHCTVLDYSEALLQIGAENADRHHYPIRFVQGDARRTRLESASYDHVLLLGNSLGYITDDEADLLILKESRRVLKPGGWLLLDVTDGEAVRAGLAPNAWHEIDDDVVVCRQREIRDDRVCAREMVLSKERGMIREATYCMRLYDARQLADLVTRSGFRDVNVHAMDETADPRVDLGCMNHRLLVEARKPLR